MILENLTEEECYLVALVQDKSGLDLAEFCYVDETREDGCFRAYPFQVFWWRKDRNKSISAGARSIGKSLSARIKTFAFPFLYPGNEMVITAPEHIHLQALTDNIEILYNNNRIAREMLSGQIKHRPFHMNFANGARLMGRIPQRDGSGVKGLHPVVLILDEGQDYPEPGWVEINSTVKKEDPNHSWDCHGVTRGDGATFDQIISGDGEDTTWEVTYLPKMYDPNWNDEMRELLIKEYHGYGSDGYRRNVLGLPSDDTSPMFVPFRIMACVDTDKYSDYNDSIYYNDLITEAQVREVDDILNLIRIPASQRRFQNIWIGMDIGWVQDPSVITVFAEEKVAKKEGTHLRLITRLLLEKISTDDQLKVIQNFMLEYHPLAYALDATGAGQPLVDMLRTQIRRNKELTFMENRIKDVNFSNKVIVGFDPNIVIDKRDPKGYEAAAIKRPFIEASIDAIRVLIDSERLILPYDKEIIGELQAAPSNVKSTVDAYGRKGRKSGMHTLDSMRLAVFSQSTQAIDEMIANHKTLWTPPGMIIM